MKREKGFTLVELLAVIAILAIILLIAVPTVLGIIEDAKVQSFRLSVLGIFDAIELEYAKTGTTSGDVSDLAMNHNPFIKGTWSFDEDTGIITIVDAGDGSYSVGTVTNQDGDSFDVLKGGETPTTEIRLNGRNPDTVNCSATEIYEDQGAKYRDQALTTTDTVDLTKAGSYILNYRYESDHTTRVVHVKNTNRPTLNITETAVTITKGDSFDASRYIESASDPCEGDITDKVQSVSEVLTDIAGTYTVTYRVKNLGNVETTKTLTVTVMDLSEPVIHISSPTGSNGWFDKPVDISLPENPDLDGYEYAISTDGGITWGDYQAVVGNKITIDQDGDNLVIKIRGKRGDKYTDPFVSDIIKIDAKAPILTPKVTNYTMTTGDDYDVSNLYTVTYGVSNGNVICKVGDTVVTNLSSLSKGSYILSCTATSVSGKASDVSNISITIQDPIYLVDIVNVGDFVNYDAGTWSSTAAKPTTPGTFGGYTSGESKNTKVVCEDDYYDYNQGWKVLSKTGSGASGVVTLIHVGTSECYYYNSSNNASTNITTIQNRITSQYLNSTYATSARNVTCTDVQIFQPNACLSEAVEVGNNLMSIDTAYFLSTTYNANSLWYIHRMNSVESNGSGVTGIRPVVVLKAGIQKTDGTGSQGRPYQISID